MPIESNIENPIPTKDKAQQFASQFAKFFKSNRENIIAYLSNINLDDLSDNTKRALCEVVHMMSGKLIDREGLSEEQKHIYHIIIKKMTVMIRKINLKFQNKMEVNADEDLKFYIAILRSKIKLMKAFDFSVSEIEEIISMELYTNTAFLFILSGNPIPKELLDLMTEEDQERFTRLNMPIKQRRRPDSPLLKSLQQSLDPTEVQMYIMGKVEVILTGCIMPRRANHSKAAQEPKKRTDLHQFLADYPDLASLLGLLLGDLSID